MSIDRPGVHGILRYATSPGFVVVHRVPVGGRARTCCRAATRRRDAPHGTTIVAAQFDGGVVMAGDRRATAGNLIAQRDIEKVFAADDYSLVGIAGTAGLGDRDRAALPGRTRALREDRGHPAHPRRQGQPAGHDDPRATSRQAMQGLAVVPLFAGFDLDADDPSEAGRIYSFDVTGGRYPERYFHAVGSGSLFARGSLKKLWRPGLDRDRRGARVDRGALRRRRRRLRDRRAGHHPRHLPGGDGGRRRGHPAPARRRARDDRARDPRRPRSAPG